MRALILFVMVGCMTAFAPAAQSDSENAEVHKAIFAGGCFWCVESDFDAVVGVVSTTSGYIGGSKEDANYGAVSAGTTGHAEAVLIEYDPEKVSYSELLEAFWHSVDPTTKNAQFCDHGSQYRTAIFATTGEQLEQAKRSKAALENTKPFTARIVTEIASASTFYPAEDYHQDYYRKNPLRYKYYRSSCRRDARLQQLWGDQALKH